MALLANTRSSQLERVADKLEKYFESSTALFSLIPKGKVETISNYLFRQPVQQWRGGQLTKVVLDEGSAGKGTGPKLTHWIAGYINSSLNYRVSTEQQETARTPEQSIYNPMTDLVANAMLEAQINADIALHGDGTGKLTNSGSATSGGNTLTFAGATDTLGVNRLREGMCVDVWDTTGATKRAAGTAAPIIIIAIDYNAKKVTFDQAVTAIAASDLLAVRNADAYGPSTLVSFSSTWPQTGVAGGLSGDSWRHGIRYFNDATTTNYYNSILKSSFPQIVPTRVNAASAGVTHAMGLQVLDGIMQRRDEDVVQGLIGIAHMTQRRMIHAAGVAIANKYIAGSAFGKIVDLGHDGAKTYGEGSMFEFATIPTYVSKRQDAAIIDFINPANIMRAQLYDTKFMENGDGGNYIFKGHDGDGGVAFYDEFFVLQSFDFASVDPGAGGYIDNLAIT